MRDGIAVYEVTIWLCFGWDFLGEFLLFGWFFGCCLDFVCLFVHYYYYHFPV